jgi:hypothetical protein
MAVEDVDCDESSRLWWDHRPSPCSAEDYQWMVVDTIRSTSLAWSIHCDTFTSPGCDQTRT